MVTYKNAMYSTYEEARTAARQTHAQCQGAHPQSSPLSSIYTHPILLKQYIILYLDPSLNPFGVKLIDLILTIKYWSCCARFPSERYKLSDYFTTWRVKSERFQKRRTVKCCQKATVCESFVKKRIYYCGVWG